MPGASHVAETESVSSVMQTDALVLNDLEHAFSVLQSTSDGEQLDQEVLNICLGLCTESESDAKILFKIAKLCIRHGNFEEAELYTIRSLLGFPKSWAAFNILTRLLSQQGKIEEASFCARKIFPNYLLDKYFPDQQFTVTTSDSKKDSGIARIEAFPGEERRLQPPRFMVANDSPAYKHQCLNSKAAFTASIDQGRLWFDGFNIVAWDKNDSIVRDVSAGYPELIHVKSQKEPVLNLGGTVCFMGNRVASNYYHWMHDVIPRIGVLLDSGINLDSIDTFILPGMPHNFHSETLAKYGINSDRIHKFTSGKFVKADTMIIPVYGSNEHLVRVDCEAWENLHSLQSGNSSRFLHTSYVSQQCANPDKKLYISRGTSGARGISNEDELIEFLETKGFETIRPENYTVQQQADIFSKASVVFGPHGAGFTNTVFCAAGTKVIEIYGDWTASCFWIISEFMGFEHYAHQVSNQECCNKISAHEQQQYSSTQEKDRLSRFHVNISEINAILEFAEVI